MNNKQKALELKKHVGAIHSSSKLTLVQRKIANALLYNAYSDLLIKDEHHIRIKLICQLIGYDSNDYTIIKKALVNLLTTVIEWNLIDKDKVDSDGIWNASSIIADATIDGSICIYSYSNKMRKLLHHPELYGRLNMCVLSKFKSSYGLALYENCIRYQNLNQTPWFEMNTFRRLMGVNEGEYLLFRDFKRRVLDKAINEVNEYSPLTITAKFQKTGHQLTAIQFIINNSQKDFLESSLSVTNETLATKLKNDFGFSKKQIDATVLNFDEKYILEKISVVESSSSFVNGKINNLARYLESALAEDYQQPKSSRINIQRLNENREQKKKLKEKENRLREEYLEYQNKKILSIYDQLPPNEKKQVLKDFESSLKGLFLDIFRRDGFSHILLRHHLIGFIKTHKSPLIESVLSFTQFCEEQASKV